MGVINILAADKLMQSPRLYATFLLWLLSELFEVLPEVGDPDKPKLVFFFDEAHLLFDDAPKALLDKIEQVVRLIRSKGVGVYFVTQNPLDIPDVGAGPARQPRAACAARLHAARPEGGEGGGRDLPRRTRSSTSQTAITELGVGEALVSFLDAKGVPEPVERCFIAPPRGRIGPATEAERAAAIKASPLADKYERTVDRESAYEVLTGRAGSGQVAHEEAAPAPQPGRRGQYDATPPPTADTPPASGPWGRSRIPQTEPAPPKPKPRLREAQPAPPPPPAAAAARAEGAGDGAAIRSARR